MGQAFDREGNLLGEATGETKREVFDKLTSEFKDAHELRIRTMDGKERDPLIGRPVSTAQGSAGYDPPRAAPERLSLQNVEQAFRYQEWSPDQIQRGHAVTEALIAAATAILLNVPECPTRTRALNMLVDSRMLANAAITHDGRF